MIFMKRTFFLPICFISAYVFAQNNINMEVNLPKFLPTSPNAASLGKFGEIPVGYYTGIPEITIPFYTIVEGKLQVPISLDYHAGGIKVEEMASCVGLGWSLRSGGVISRSQRGLEDEMLGYGFKYAYDSARKYYNHEMDAVRKEAYRLNILRGIIDSESDIFYFNFPGGSGKFFFTDEGKIVTSPRSDLRVESFQDKWVITTGDGTRYIFKDYENTQAEPYTMSSNSAWTSGNAINTSSSVFLSDIVNIKGDSVHFVYTNSMSFFRTKAVETINTTPFGYNPSTVPPFTVSTYSQNSITAKTLTEIRFSSGKVVFLPKSTPRLDDELNFSMDRIAVINAFGDTIKQFKLHQSYFTNSYVGGGMDENLYRLRLDSIQEVKSNFSLGSYCFTYNSTQLPKRLSNAQDYWGYYNGKNNSEFVRYKLSLTGPMQGADKTPDSTYAKACVLEKIKYPTGGVTEFEYEGNTYAEWFPPGFDKEDHTTLTFLSGNNSNPEGAWDYLQTFQNTFSVSPSQASQTGYLYVSSNLQRSCADNNVICYINVKVYGNNGYYKELTSSNDTLHLPAGSYTIEGTIETEFAGRPYASFYVDLQSYVYKDSSYFKTRPYGGLRIKTIRSNASNPVNATVQKFVYTQDGLPSSPSTGVVPPFPDFSYTKVNRDKYGGAPTEYVVYNSVTNYPLTLAGGKPIGYAKVTTLYGINGENGKKELDYTTWNDHSDLWNGSFPFPPANDREWKRGLLKRETTYAYKNSVYVPVETKVIEYQFHTFDTTTKRSKSVKIGKNVEIIGEGQSNWSLNQGLVGEAYLTEAEAFNISSDTTYIYHESVPSQYLTKWNEYQYSNKNFQLKTKKEKNSNGEIYITNIRYPLDYGTAESSVNAAKALHRLKSLNAISLPVETYQTKKYLDNSEKVLKGVLTTYKTTVLQPDTVYSLELNPPLNLASFSVSNVVSNNFIKDDHYKARLAINKYHASGEVAEQQKIGDVVMSYIWDYVSKYPIAQVVNADSSSIAYTSFEADGTGNWAGINSVNIQSTGGITGSKHYSQTGFNLSKAGLISSKSYLVSYWSKNGSYTIAGTQTGYPKPLKSITIGSSTWTLYEHLISGQSTITVTGSGSIDELRLYPKGAQMTTYTYEPLIGISSQADINNRITYYEYDGFGRLSLVRDQDRNILKKYCYNYAGQIEECGIATFYSAAKSGTFTRNNCASGGSGSSVTYTVAASTYTSTISQADADQKAQNDVNANGQSYANTNGYCTFFSTQKSGSFIRNNCSAGGVGSLVTYTVAAGAYSSTLSQADADQKAQNDVNFNGQTFANNIGYCTFYNVQKSGTFTRSNCASGGTGSSVTYTVAAGSYSSTLSQADADQKAVNDVSANGQTFANNNGFCTWYNVTKSGTFSRNNCAAGGTPGTVVYTVAAGTYSSTISQADADQKAQNDVNANGQTYANNNGSCTYYNTAVSGSYTKNNCAAGSFGSTVTYTVAAGTYSSNVSQSAANNLAQSDVNANGQAYANSNGTCTWYNAAKSGTFTRNNCGSGSTGSTVTYTVYAGAYNSTVSQADADQKAQNDVNANGQSYANTYGSCTAICTNCTAPDKKCINGVCETGTKVCSGSYFDGSIMMFVNMFYYRWSDNSTSQNYTEYDFCNCDFTQCF